MFDSESPVFCFDFLYLLDPTIERHIDAKNEFQTIYKVLYYVLICIKSPFHGLAVPEHETIVCFTVDVHSEGSPGIFLCLQELVFCHLV